MTAPRQRRIPGEPITSLAEFLRELDRVHLAISHNGEDSTWFRGQGDGSWKLRPRLYREDYEELRDYEDDIRADFDQLAWPYLKEATWEPRTSWEWYFVMQHHGVPTRLLDWTESGLIALYFALKDALNQPKATSNPAVWALSTFSLNRFVAHKGDVILAPTEPKASPYLPPPFGRRRLPQRPIALMPPHKTVRIAAQQGFFTIHGASRQGLESYGSLRKHCVKIEITRAQVTTIKEQLRVAGIAETDVFPELDGLARELVDYYRWEQPQKKKKRPAPRSDNTR